MFDPNYICGIFFFVGVCFYFAHSKAESEQCSSGTGEKLSVSEDRFFLS